MDVKSILVAVSLLLLPCFAWAAQLRVGPEILLQLPPSTSADADAKLLSIAGADLGFASLYESSGNIWFVRVAPDGAPLDPTGISLGATGLAHSAGSISWTGSRWFAAWTTSAGVSTAFIEPSGVTVSSRMTEIPISRNGLSMRSAWNGSNGVAQGEAPRIPAAAPPAPDHPLTDRYRHRGWRGQGISNG